MPFTQAQFFDVFRAYNIAVWPAQLVLNGLALIAIALAARGRAPRLISLILAAFWAWMAIAYHLSFFARINRAAIGFGIVFLIQALIFFWLGVVKERIDFGMRRDFRTATGVALVLYSLFLYPAVGWLLGRRYPAAPTFGLPCPTTILTFALLLWTRRPLPRAVLVIPTLWALLGVTAATTLSVTEDYGLLIAAIASVAWTVAAGHTRRQNAGDTSAVAI